LKKKHLGANQMMFRKMGHKVAIFQGKKKMRLSYLGNKLEHVTKA